MPFPPEGTLTTDERGVSVSESWETQTEWEAYQSIDGINITNGTLELDDTSDIPDSIIGRYDATQLSLTDSDSVSSWPDLSAEGNDLGNGTTPTYRDSVFNGNSAVEFNGSSTYLDTNTTTYTSPRTVIAVLDTIANSGDQTVFDGGSTNTNRSMINRTANASGGGYALYSGSFISDSTDGLSEQTISTFIVDGTSSVIRKNGVELVRGDAGSTTIEGFTVGVRGDASSNFYEGYIGEIRVYNDNLETTGELSSQENALATKWGITI